MIQEVKGMLLSVPAPLQLTMNYCSHACTYCFANLNKPDRTYKEKETINTIMKHRQSKTLRGEFLRQKYPLLASNLVDVFSKNNHKHFLELYKVLRKEGIPLAFQTRGGFGVDEVLKTLPPSYFYISLTSHDDDLIKKIEPNAPKPSERVELIKKLHRLGHKIEIGINPYMPEVCDIEKIMEQTREYTQFYWINQLHINNNQKRNMKPKARTEIELLTTKTEQQTLEEAENAINTMIEWGVIPTGIPNYGIVDRTELYSMYENKLPTVNDFLIHIVSTKKEGDFIYFEDYEKFFTENFPEWLNKFDSGYIVSVKRNFNGLKPSYSLSEVLKFHWNNYQYAESSIVGTSLVFAPVFDEVDKNGNIYFKYLIKPIIHK